MNTIAISGGRALAGAALEPLDQATILVEDGTIAAVASEPAGGDAARFDASGMTLLPGFIDAHVHIGFYAPEQLLAGGVTTARDLGWPPERIHPLARASRAADFAGPLLLAAGPMLTAPGGYPSRAAWAPPGTAREIASDADAVDAVDQTIAEGASIIKVALNPPVGPTLDHDSLKAIVARAHACRLKVTGHIYGLDELEKALDAGVDELAHMLMSPERLPTWMIDRLVSQGVVVVPTLAIREGGDLEVAVENLRRFRDSGGRIVYGTDLGNSGPGPGIDPREIAGMVEAGMDAAAIVGSATVQSASWLGLSTKGVLAPGYDADIVGVRGDPTKDPGVLSDVALVCRGGRIFSAGASLKQD